MNGATPRNSNGYTGEVNGGSPKQTSGLPGRTLVEGYRQDILNGFEPTKPLYNPLNPERPQSSALVDLKDPIQVHLLTETALSDSKGYEILSQEEVDDLKKQCQSLLQRIDQARANLAIQSKYRDAAISMSKLYAPGGPKRRSLLGNRTSGGQSARDADIERQASEKRCEELATELFSLEKRIMEPQRRLLQHTAGILQLTHKASKRAAAAATHGPPVNGVPGSPESLYTFSNSRSSMDPAGEDPYFDDRSLYVSLDTMDKHTNRPRKNTLEIPVKSPIREQTIQLREETEKLREENGRLQGFLSGTERKLNGLGSRIQELVIQVNIEKNAGYPAPPACESEHGISIGDQLRYLEDGLLFLQQEQEENGADPRSTASLTDAEERIQAFNDQIRDLLRNLNSDELPIPELSRPGLEGQLDLLQELLRTVESELASGMKSADKHQAEQTGTVLAGLWDIIQSGYADIQKRKADRRATRMQMGLPADDDDVSSDEEFDTNEPYSLQAFSTRVQWLYAQATNLKEQKAVLKRQIKQQRDLNSKSDSEKELELQKRDDEMESTRILLNRTEQEAMEAQEKLAQAMMDLETLRVTNSANESASVQAAQSQLQERNAAIASLELNNKELQNRLSDAEARLMNIDAQLQEASRAKVAVDADVENIQKQITAKDEELEQMNLMVVELKTELTIAQAELDGAYGSRSQRAAEAAKLTNNSENEELKAQVEKLRIELTATLREFEELTKDTLGAEKEKLELEGRLDDALAARSSLETEIRTLRDKMDAEVSRLKEQLDGERLKAGGTAGSKPSAGASMLSEQFRATMKEERKKFQEELREEQMRRRKLEEELRAIKRAQGPGRSPLSPR